MMARYLARSDLRQRLSRQGHSFTKEAATRADGTDVHTPPRIRVTVAVDPDLSLAHAYRKRYFAFRPEWEPGLLPPCDSCFRLPPAFALAAKREPGAGCLMDGPVRWLLHRLRKFPRLLVWALSGSLSHTESGWIPEVFERAPRLRRLHPKVCRPGQLAGAVVLNQTNAADAQVLWSVTNHVSQLGDDYFVSDMDASEVYLLYHHDEIVISIPDRQRRKELLRELAGWSDVLMDCSGYKGGYKG